RLSWSCKSRASTCDRRVSAFWSAPFDTANSIKPRAIPAATVRSDIAWSLQPTIMACHLPSCSVGADADTVRTLPEGCRVRNAGPERLADRYGEKGMSAAADGIAKGSPRLQARIAGFLYLLIILGAVFIPFHPAPSGISGMALSETASPALIERLLISKP